jgi:hypothetical protein
MSPSPPDGLVENLRRLDPDLRLRWGRHQAKWIIEVKVQERLPQREQERPSPVGTSPRALDWWEGWTAIPPGLYVTALPQPCPFPWDFIAAHLKHLSLEAHQAKDRLIERLDAAEREEEMAAKRKWAVGNEAAAKTLYDDFAWEQGRRVSLNQPGANPKIEPRDGFSVVDRRVRA